ncbi:MAG: Ig-like domain-containing protein [Bryobacteraceae bacterium]
MKKVKLRICSKIAALSAGTVLLCACKSFAQKNSVSIALNGSGLSSLEYQGVNYLGYGSFRLNAVQFQTPSGVVNGDNSGSCSMNYGASQLTCSYGWGTITATYSVSNNQFLLAIATKNNSSNTITGLFLEPLAIHFPVKPLEYDGNTPILADNIGEPAVLKMTFGSNALALVDNGTLSLMLGFPFAADRPQSMQLFPLRINTGTDPTYPNSLPNINRPIAPGQTDTYHISIRFGTAAMTAYNFAPDIYARFTTLYPHKLNWTDRRPIASLILATTATGWPTNPRGWLLDPTINVTTAAGIQNLHDRIMAWADNSIAIMQQMNAQGMVTWDIEGEQYPQPTTYIGDPRVFATLAPEMRGIADEYFQKFRTAGFRVGVCLRPQQLVISGGSVTQNTIADPTSLLISKINYAKRRWGATLFYVDSNGDPNNPMVADIFARVAAAEPDVLLIPEHETLGYYGSTAPYRELRGGWTSSPPLVREIYPTGFSVINTADGDIDANEAQLKQAVAQGDVMMFRGWFDDPNNVKVKALYPAPSVAPPPSISFLTPAFNQYVSGIVQITASATSSVGIGGVEYLLDNQALGQKLGTAPYASSLATANYLSGYHLLTAIASDIYGTTNAVAIPVVF